MTLNIGDSFPVATHLDLALVAAQVGGDLESNARLCAINKSVLMVKPNTIEWGYSDRFWLVGLSQGIMTFEVTNRLRSRRVLDVVNQVGAENVSAIIRYNKGCDCPNLAMVVRPSLTVYVPLPFGTLTLEAFAATVDAPRDEGEFLE